uniref:Uncharacterized protein n=1 Tax=Aegilops tauschii subsp. strangulata TaxID=200361 RepID=A0A452YTM5_AEGTS
IRCSHCRFSPLHVAIVEREKRETCQSREKADRGNTWREHKSFSSSSAWQGQGDHWLRIKSAAQKVICLTSHIIPLICIQQPRRMCGGIAKRRACFLPMHLKKIQKQKHFMATFLRSAWHAQVAVDWYGVTSPSSKKQQLKMLKTRMNR